MSSYCRLRCGSAKDQVVCAAGAVDHYGVAIAERTFEELDRQRVLNQVLNGAFERAGSERRIVAFGRDQVSGRGTDLEADTTFGQQVAQAGQLQFNDVTKLFPVQWSEYNDVVHAVQEFGAEMATKFSQH